MARATRYGLALIFGIGFRGRPGPRPVLLLPRLVVVHPSMSCKA